MDDMKSLSAGSETVNAVSPDTAREDTVRAEKVKILVAGTTSGIIVSMINIGLVTWLQWGAVEPAVLFGWVTVMGVLLAGRLSVNGLYTNARPGVGESKRWANILTASSLVTGIGWGTTGFLMTPAESLPHQVLTAFVLAGMSAGALSTLYPLRNAYIAYVTPLLTPLILRLFSEPDSIHLVMGTMVTLYLFYVIAAASRLRQVLEETLELRFDNEALVRSLNDEATERAQAEAARAGSERRYRRVVESAADAIFVHDLDGRFIDVNQQACDSLGYGRGELLSLNVFDIEKGADPEALKRIWTDMGAGAFPVTLEGEHLRRDGSAFPVEVKLGLLEEEGEPAFIALARDITERKKVDSLKSEFISTVSHELRTPLTSILGSLGLIIAGGGGPVSEKVGSMLAMAERNAKRLVHLVNDILDFEKLESGRMQFSFTDIDMPALLREAIEANRGYADHHDVRFVVAEPLESAVVAGDSKRLMQVISNLLSNAAKFSPAGGEVSLSLCVRDGMARVAVADRGDGIPEAFRAQLFNRFTQAGDVTTRKTSGTGLGLSISKAIVEAHGGTIGFDTEEDEGTTFYFDLPILLDRGRPD